MLRDQEVLAKQLENTGKAVASLIMQQKPPGPPPSPTHSDDMESLVVILEGHHTTTGTLSLEVIRMLMLGLEITSSCPN